MRWITKRIGQAFFTAYLVISLTFALTRLMPGGPMQALRAELEAQGEYANIEVLEQQMKIIMNINPDLPLHIQYFNYITEVVQGQLGTSLWYSRPVIQIILEGLPWTLFVMLSAVFLNFFIAVIAGAIMAYYESSKLDLALTSYSLIITAIPYYIVGLLLIFLLSYQLNIFPSGGRYGGGVEVGLNLPFIINALHHAALPIASFALTRMAKAITMRANSIQILGSDYVRAARVRGIPGPRIATRYVGRNAVLPLYTKFMISIGDALGGAIVLEMIFSYPGIGFYMFQAVQFRDYSLMMGIFLIISLAVVMGLLIADLTYGLIDPRISADNTAR